jgi:chondroitin AC lyase
VRAQNSEEEIGILKDRLKSYYSEMSSGNYETYQTSQTNDGSWPDINYNNTSGTTFMEVIEHLIRLRKMSVAYYNIKSEQNIDDVSLKNKIETGLKFWYDKKPTSVNGVYNTIIPQQELMPILLLMEDELSASTINTGKTFLNDPSEQATGANLVWIAAQPIHRGLLGVINMADIELGLEKIASTICISSGEGIKQDYSFHQHKEQLYNCGYGLHFTNDVALWFYLTRNLSFTFNDDNLNIFTNYILDGIRWMTYKTDLDYSTVGRTIAYKYFLNKAANILPALKYMSIVNTSKSNEFKDYINNIEGEEFIFEGNKHFWLSDYHSHRRKNYAVSVKMWSDRVISGESTNNVNIKGYYLSCGAMYIANKKDSYYNIAPVWDWCKIPGTTCPQKDTPPLITRWDFYGSTSFVGGVTNNKYGVASMDLNFEGVTAKKSWFFFDEEVVALGAGISSTVDENICTSINQAILRESVDDGSKQFENGYYELSSPLSIYHDNIAYIILDDNKPVLKTGQQTGNWWSVNNYYSKENVSEDIFSLWLDHGSRPVDVSYKYIILPDATDGEGAKYLDIDNSPIKIIKNTSDIQAVINRNHKITGMVFHKEGSLIHNSLKVSVNKPCILLMDEKNGTLSASNPYNSSMKLQVTITINDKQEVINFSFPDGENAGKSITAMFTIYGTNNKDENLEKTETFVKVYPNPAKEYINISVFEKGLASIYDLDGNKVAYKELTQPQEKIELTTLAPGSYILSIEMGGGKQFTKKIILEE